MLLGLPLAGTYMLDLHAGWRDDVLAKFNRIIPEDQQPKQVGFNSKHGPSKA